MQRLTGQLVRPAPRHRGSMRERRPAAPASYNEQDVLGQALVPRHAGTVRSEPVSARGDRPRMRERRESLLAVDEAVDGLVRELARQGELGQHLRDLHLRQRLHAGRAPGSAGQDVPLRPVHSGAAADSRSAGCRATGRSKALVGNVDLTPTIVQGHAGANPPAPGRTVLPALRARVRLRSLRPLLHETGGNGRARPRQARRGRKGTAAARPGLARRAHDALAVRRLRGGPARAVRPQARPGPAALAERRPALPGAAADAAPDPGGPVDLSAAGECQEWADSFGAVVRVAPCGPGP